MTEQIKEAYETFTDVVTRAVYSVENKSYGYNTFFTILNLHMNNTGVNYIDHEIATYNPSEVVDYKGFSKAVSNVVINTERKTHQESFNTINELIDAYAVPRHQIQIEKPKTLQKTRF